MELEGTNLTKLDMKARYLLSQMKVKSTEMWEEYVDSYNEVDIEDLPTWYQSAVEAYRSLPDEE